MAESFKVEKIIIDASHPRAPGSTIFPDDRLRLVYNKFSSKTLREEKSKVKINLIFTHGTGMSKAIWNFHIRRLFRISQISQDWVLNIAISIDSVGHCDSAALNQESLGALCDWGDCARDVLEVVRHEQEDNNLVQGSMVKNILIGHSFGGFVALYAAFLEPFNFDAVIPIEPVAYFSIKEKEYFLSFVNKLERKLEGSFSSEEAFRQYFLRYSFTKFMEPEIQNDLMEDERLVMQDRIKIKSEVKNQLSVYYGAMYSLPKYIIVLTQLRVPTYLVAGNKALWNIPGSIDYVKRAILPDYLLRVVDIPEGGHLLHLERASETTILIHEFLMERVKICLAHRQKDLDYYFKGKRREIYDYQWKYVRTLSFDKDISVIDEDLLKVKL